MPQKKHISLAVKLNAIVVAAILVVSVGLVGIAFRVYCERVDEVYEDRLADAHESGDYLVDTGAIAFLWDSIQTDEFSQIHEQAVAAQDDSIVSDWLESQEIDVYWEGEDTSSHLIGYYENLLNLFKDHISYLEYIQSTANVTSAYIQVMKDGVTYTLIDPELGYLGLGEIEDSLPEFEGYGDNEQVPYTVYKSRYGWLGTMCEPIVDETTNETVGLLCVDVDMNEVMAERWNFIIHSIAFVLAITVVATAVSVYLIRRIATRPLRQLTDAASGFCDLEDDNLEDNIIDVDIRSNDEIGELVREIRLMQERIVDYTDNMARVTAEKERTKTEMNMANAIQESMLPNIFPCFPERPEFDIYASMDPAKEVGGDFYDFFLIDDNHLGLVIADVSGKGIPAALFMMSVKIMIFDRAQMGGTPAEILTYVNAQICEHNPTKTFVSVWMGMLDIQTGIMTCTNAGHLYPYVRGADGSFRMLKDKHGLVVGGVKRMKYRDYAIEFEPGDAIFVYTDGAPEARNAEGAFFGNAALESALNACDGTAPQEVLENVKSHVLAFMGGAEPFDDLTMLCLEYRGPLPMPVAEVTLPATVEGIPEAMAFVSEQLDALGCPAKAKKQVTIAIDEIMSNIARYAYESLGGTVSLRFQAQEHGTVAEIAFIDQGIAYNPLDAAEPDTRLAARQRAAGGLGVFLVRKTMDDVTYERKGNENVLTIRKRIAGE